MAKSPSHSMNLDILAYAESQDIIFDFPKVKEYGFHDYEGSMKKGGLNRNHVIIYIILLYSSDSFLNNNRTPLRDRQLQAADLAGFSRGKDGNFSDSIEDSLFMLEDETVRKMIFTFLYNQEGASHVWAKIMVLEHNIRELYRELLEPLQKQDKKLYTGGKGKVFDEIDDLEKRLKEAKKIFYSDHDLLEQKEHRERVKDTIEDFAI